MSESAEFLKESPPEITQDAATPIRAIPALTAIRTVLTDRRQLNKLAALLLAAAAGLVTIILVGKWLVRSANSDTIATPATASGYLASHAMDALRRPRLLEAKALDALGTAAKEVQEPRPIPDEAVLPSIAPMIARNAELSMVVKRVDSARSDLDGILARYRSYVGQLSEASGSDGGKSLQATIHIPAQSLDSALIELRKLGVVTQESQSGEDVTMQHADLVARLTNARETERRLLEILRTRTGKVADVLEVEEKISATREQIEQMEAGQKVLQGRASFATLTLGLAQDFRAQLGSTSSAGSRLRNAFVAGIRDAREMLLSLSTWAIALAPSAFAWLLILFFPPRWGLRKWRWGLARS
jgi:hypothetical protein